MRIAVIGYGKMGQAIKSIATQRGHQVTTIDPAHPEADYQELSSESLENIDVGIEFTRPDAAVKNIKNYLEHSDKLVVGTTGWYDQLADIQAKLKGQKGLIYATNFSVGVNVFFKVVEAAAKIINKFPEFDVSALDIHHNKKVDSPSGTAMTTAELLVNNIERKTAVIYDKLDRAPANNEIHFASLRAGSVPGTHQVLLDSPAESVNIEVVARNREGYALGSVIAAEWIANNQGFHRFEDLIDQIINS